MEAAKEITAAQINSELESGHTSNPVLAAFNRQAAAFEHGRFAWMTILITAQSCLGSVACMFLLYNKVDAVWLATCAAVTMGSNAAFIAQVSAKWSLVVFYISIIANAAFILLNAPLGL